MACGRGRRGSELTSGSARPAALARARNFASSSLRVSLGSWAVARARAPLPRCPLRAVDDVGDRAVVVELEALGLRERALEAVGADRGREVEEGAGDGGGRDALVGGGVTGIEGAGLMHRHARNRVAAVAYGHLRAGARRREQAPPRCGAAMAEHGPAAAGQDGREGPALATQPTVADRVDAAIEPMQAPRLHATSEGRRRQSERMELLHRHHAPLSDGQLGHRRLTGWATCLSHSGSEIAHPTSVGRLALRIYKRLCRIRRWSGPIRARARSPSARPAHAARSSSASGRPAARPRTAARRP